MSAVRYGIARARSFGHDLNDAHEVIFTRVVPAVLGLLVGMLILNCIGLKELNGFVGAGMWFVALYFGFSPKAVFYALGLGTVVQGLRDEDITKGSIQGVVVLYRMVLAVLWGSGVIAMVLAVVPFRNNPLGFFILVGALAMIMLTHTVVKNKWGKNIMTAFLVFVILKVLFSLAFGGDKEEEPPAQQPTQLQYRSMTGVPEQVMAAVAESTNGRTTVTLTGGCTAPVDIQPGYTTDFTGSGVQAWQRWQGQWSPQRGGTAADALMWCGNGTVEYWTYPATAQQKAAAAA